jgi:hypothetical protein
LLASRKVNYDYGGNADSDDDDDDDLKHKPVRICLVIRYLKYVKILFSATNTRKDKDDEDENDDDDGNGNSDDDRDDGSCGVSLYKAISTLLLFHYSYCIFLQSFSAPPPNILPLQFLVLQWVILYNAFFLLIFS